MFFISTINNIEIQNSNLNKIVQIGISENVYLEEYDEMHILHIYVPLKNEFAVEFRNSAHLKCSPTVSDDKSILFLTFYVKDFSFQFPMSINEKLINFLNSKYENFSNRIELHIFNESNEIISNKELFHGENNSSVAMSAILTQIYQ